MRRSSFSVIAVKPERDKVTRMSIQSGKFEAGRVFFPYRAPWLSDLEAELFAFPGSRHDDQVDSISQALGDEPKPFWTERSLDGLNKVVEAIARDRYFGFISGRPW